MDMEPLSDYERPLPIRKRDDGAVMIVRDADTTDLFTEKYGKNRHTFVSCW